MLVDYKKLLDEAMLDIIRKVLVDIEKNGIQGKQCFYLSFDTKYPGVILSSEVKKRHPQEITIILQYQFRNLEVMQDKFLVNIYFNGIEEKIEVPLKALTSFVDPLANFNLQLKIPKSKVTNYSQEPKRFMAKTDQFQNNQQKQDKSTPIKTGSVVNIEEFRKKS